MDYRTILLKIENYYLRLLLIKIWLCFNVRVKCIEVISKRKHFKILIEAHFTFTNDIHCELIVKVDVIILLLDHVGIMIRIEKDELYIV